MEGNREVPGGERDSHIILAVPQVLIAKIAVCVTRRAQSSDDMMDFSITELQLQQLNLQRLSFNIDLPAQANTAAPCV